MYVCVCEVYLEMVKAIKLQSKLNGRLADGHSLHLIALLLRRLLFFLYLVTVRDSKVLTLAETYSLLSVLLNIHALKYLI